MNATETIALCRVAAAICPQQAFDAETPKGWALLLEDVRLEDAKDALIQLGRTQPFVSPAEIRGVVRRVRAKRIAEVGDLTPPPGTEAEQREWLRWARSQIGDGKTVDQLTVYGELKERHLPDIRALMPAPDDQKATSR